jgi:hypothetical protein
VGAPGDDADATSERERMLQRAVDVRTWLETETDPRRAVIGCWLRLEQAAGEAGEPRAPSETAGDLTLRVLGRWPIDPEPVQQLRRRFEAARFSPATVGQADSAIARTALAAIITGLSAAGSLGSVAAGQRAVPDG